MAEREEICRKCETISDSIDHEHPLCFKLHYIESYEHKPSAFILNHKNDFIELCKKPEVLNMFIKCNVPFITTTASRNVTSIMIRVITTRIFAFFAVLGTAINEYSNPRELYEYVLPYVGDFLLRWALHVYVSHSMWSAYIRSDMYKLLIDIQIKLFNDMRSVKCEDLFVDHILTRVMQLNSCVYQTVAFNAIITNNINLFNKVSKYITNECYFRSNICTHQDFIEQSKEYDADTRTLFDIFVDRKDSLHYLKWGKEKFFFDVVSTHNMIVNSFGDIIYNSFYGNETIHVHTQDYVIGNMMVLCIARGYIDIFKSLLYNKTFYGRDTLVYTILMLDKVSFLKLLITAPETTATPDGVFIDQMFNRNTRINFIRDAIEHAAYRLPNEDPNMIDSIPDSPLCLKFLYNFDMLPEYYRRVINRYNETVDIRIDIINDYASNKYENWDSNIAGIIGGFLSY